MAEGMVAAPPMPASARRMRKATLLLVKLEPSERTPRTAKPPEKMRMGEKRSATRPNWKEEPAREGQSAAAQDERSGGYAGSQTAGTTQR